VTKFLEVAPRERGQLTPPKSLRDALHLEPGEMLRNAKVGNAIVLRPQRMDPDALCQQMRGLMKGRGVTAEDVLRDR
jgi:bifunctional DNA-binding transcriptional regulator/antitoxin component of YhaV-PrlF toxin-antitoxin module